MKRWALVANGTCVMVVVQDTQPAVAGDWEDVTGLFVGPGFTKDGNAWVEPIAPPEQP